MARPFQLIPAVSLPIFTEPQVHLSKDHSECRPALHFVRLLYLLPAVSRLLHTVSWLLGPKLHNYTVKLCKPFRNTSYQVTFHFDKTSHCHGPAHCTQAILGCAAYTLSTATKPAIYKMMGTFFIHILCIIMQNKSQKDRSIWAESLQKCIVLITIRTEILNVRSCMYKQCWSWICSKVLQYT